MIGRSITSVIVTLYLGIQSVMAQTNPVQRIDTVSPNLSKSSGHGYQSPLLDDKMPLLKALNLDQSVRDFNLEPIEKKIRTVERNVKARGGVDTGGGTLVKTPEGIGLLDLYLYNPKVFNSREMNPQNVQETQALNSLGIELLRNKKNPLFSKVLSHLKRWETKSPIVVGQVVLALQNLPFYYHKDSIKKQPIGFFLPLDSKIGSSDLKMVAVFDEKIGVHFSFEELRLLPETHQIALVIHECLRLINFTGNLNLTNEKIQKLTAELMNDPEDSISVDREEHLLGEIALESLNLTKLFLEASSFSKKICKRAYMQNSSFCQISDEGKSFDELIELFKKGFIELYALANQESSAELKRDLGSAYHLVMELENTRLKHILNSSVYVSKYIELRARFMQLDLVIEKENSI